MTCHFDNARELIDVFHDRNPSVSVSLKFVDTLPQGEVYQINQNGGSYVIAIPQTTKICDYLDVLGTAFSELESHMTGQSIAKCAGGLSGDLTSRVSTGKRVYH